MNECWKTKLGAVVNDGNLPYFGGVKVNIKKLTSPSEYAHKLGIAPATTMKIVGSGTVTIDGTDYTSASGTVTLAGNKNLSFSNDDFYIVLFFKYYTNGIDIIPKISPTSEEQETFVDRGISIDLSQFDYGPLNSINCNGVDFTGRIKNFSKAQYFDILATNSSSYTQCSLVIDSADMATNTILKHFKYEYKEKQQYIDSGSKVELDLSHFYNKTSMNILHATYCEVTGDIVDLAAGQVEAGRTSGYINLKLANSGATVDGTYWTQNSIKNKYSLQNTVWTINIYFGSSYTKGYVIKVGDTIIIQ